MHTQLIPHLFHICITFSAQSTHMLKPTQTSSGFLKFEPRTYSLLGKHHSYQIINSYSPSGHLNHAHETEKRESSTASMILPQSQPEFFIQIIDEESDQLPQQEKKTELHSQTKIDFRDYLPKLTDKFYEQDDENIGAHDLGEAELDLKCFQELLSSNNIQENFSPQLTINPHKKQKKQKKQKKNTYIQVQDLMVVEENEYLSNSKKRRKEKIQEYSNGTTTTRMKVISKTQDEYEKEKKYLRKEYQIRNNCQRREHEFDKKNNKCYVIDCLEEVEQIDEKQQYLKESNLQKIKRKLGLMKQLNQQVNNETADNEGRAFEQAPEYKPVPKKIHEYPPTCLVPEFGRYEWPPKMSQHRIWKRQTTTYEYLNSTHLYVRPTETNTTRHKVMVVCQCSSKSTRKNSATQIPKQIQQNISIVIRRILFRKIKSEKQCYQFTFLCRSL